MPTAMRSKGFIAIALLPALLLFLIFVIIPVFWSAYYGFFSWKGFGDATFIGLDNYIEMFKDPIFWRALRNNLILVVSSIIGQVPIALILAIVLFKNSFFSRFIRSAVFMPMVLHGGCRSHLGLHLPPAVRNCQLCAGDARPGVMDPCLAVRSEGQHAGDIDPD